MDDRDFLRELAEAGRMISGGVGDVRAGVWRRIEAGGGVEVEMGVAERFQSWMWTMDVAAAAAVFVCGSVASYSLIARIVGEMYWDGAGYGILSWF